MNTRVTRTRTPWVQKKEWLRLCFPTFFTREDVRRRHDDDEDEEDAEEDAEDDDDDDAVG